MFEREGVAGQKCSTAWPMPHLQLIQGKNPPHSLHLTSRCRRALPAVPPPTGTSPLPAQAGHRRWMMMRLPNSNDAMQKGIRPTTAPNQTCRRKARAGSPLCLSNAAHCRPRDIAPPSLARKDWAHSCLLLPLWSSSCHSGLLLLQCRGQPPPLCRWRLPLHCHACADTSAIQRIADCRMVELEAPERRGSGRR